MMLKGSRYSLNVLSEVNEACLSLRHVTKLSISGLIHWGGGRNLQLD